MQFTAHTRSIIDAIARGHIVDQRALRRWFQSSSHAVIPWTPLYAAFISNDVEYIKGFIYGAWSIDAPCTLVQALLSASPCLSDLHTWLKIKLVARGYFRPSGEYQKERGFSTLFHFGFVGIPETEEHLRRLRDMPEEPSTQLTIATPAIERTNTVLVPIDSVAARVLGKGDHELPYGSVAGLHD